MTSREVALALLAVAAVVYLGVARPLRAKAAAYADAYGAARVDRHDAVARVTEQQRRSQSRARAVAALKGAAADPAGTTRAVRGSVARAVEGSPSTRPQLTIRPGANGVEVRVTARGPAADVLDLAGQLAKPEYGVVLQHVSFARSEGRVGLTVEGLGIAGTR